MNYLNKLFERNDFDTPFWKYLVKGIILYSVAGTILIWLMDKFVFHEKFNWQVDVLGLVIAFSLIDTVNYIVSHKKK